MHKAYSVEIHDPNYTGGQSQRGGFFSDPAEAVQKAQELSVEHEVTTSVVYDARGFVSCQKGVSFLRFTWEHFYTGEPSTEYLALVEACRNTLSTPIKGLWS